MNNMNIIFSLISILKKFFVAVFLQNDGYGTSERASEMAKLIGCLQRAEPGKHPKNERYDIPLNSLFIRTFCIFRKIEVVHDI
jgi:hypothetical protein